MYQAKAGYSIKQGIRLASLGAGALSSEQVEEADTGLSRGRPFKGKALRKAEVWLACWMSSRGPRAPPLEWQVKGSEKEDRRGKSARVW